MPVRKLHQDSRQLISTEKSRLRSTRGPMSTSGFWSPPVFRHTGKRLTNQPPGELFFFVLPPDTRKASFNHWRVFRSYDELQFLSFFLLLFWPWALPRSWKPRRICDRTVNTWRVGSFVCGHRWVSRTLIVFFLRIVQVIIFEEASDFGNATALLPTAREPFTGRLP